MLIPSQYPGSLPAHIIGLTPSHLRRRGEHGDAERYGSQPLLVSAFEVDEKADRAPDQAGEPDDGRAIHYE